MAEPIPAGMRLGVVAPRDAVAVFQQRNLLLPSFNWHEVYGQAHARGVAVAGVLQADVLQAFSDEIGVSLAEGRSLADFAKRIRPKLQEKGYWGDVTVTDPVDGKTRVTRFDDARLRLIYNVNLGQSFMAGKWDRFQRTKRIFPFVIYITKRDGLVRDAHAAWDGLALPIDDTFWDTHWPKNGWGCRCDVIQADQRTIDRRTAAGDKIRTKAPPVEYVTVVNKRTGTALRTPRGIDPGFGHNPGKRPMQGVVPPALRADPFKRSEPSFQPTEAMPFPRRVPASMVLPEGTPVAEANQAFLSEFGAGPGHPAEFTDARGKTLVIDDELFHDITGEFKGAKRERDRYMRLLAYAIKSPDEIWEKEEWHFARQVRMVRRRYVARFIVGDERKPMLAVFEEGKEGWLADVWRGITTYQPEKPADEPEFIAKARVGARIFVRGDGP